MVGARSLQGSLRHLQVPTPGRGHRRVDDVVMKCHTLKYVNIFKYIHTSLEFFKNILKFSGNYSLIRRVKSIY
jgi:hypothetical protein